VPKDLLLNALKDSLTSLGTYMHDYRVRTFAWTDCAWVIC